MTIKETFEEAFQNHKKNNFKIAEKLYKKILTKQPDHFGSIFYLGTLAMQIKNFDEAKIWYKKAIKIKPNLPDAYNNLGNIEQNLGDLENAKICYERAIKANPNYPAAHNNLGTIQQSLGDLAKAKICYEQAIKVDPNYPAAYNNLGNVFNELGKYKEAQGNCEKAIKINSKYASAYNNLGNAFKKLKEHKKAIASYNQAIKINPNYISAHDNLGKILRDLGKPGEAKKYFQKVNTSSSRGESLECTYFSESLINYKKELEKLTTQDPLNLRVATIAAYISKKESIENIYPFCKDPLNFVHIKNLKQELDSNKNFLINLLEKLKKINSVWEPNSYTTKGGYQTMGNLFNIEENEILILKKVIEKQIIIYRDKFKDCEDFFIKKWPEKNKFRAWHVKLLHQGHQKSHIHPAGWLSGVFYIKIPQVLNKNEGSIEFTFHGYDYPNHENLTNFIHTPKVFDMVLFPSSLFHRTIPFNSQDDRQSIAFDLVPQL